MDFPTEMLKILVCTSDHGELEFKGDHLICKKCKAKYPIIDGIPDMNLRQKAGRK